LYTPGDFDAVISAAGRIRGHGDTRREWRALGLPGSYQQFRRWVRRLQAFGYIEVPDRMGREIRSA